MRERDAMLFEGQTVYWEHESLPWPLSTLMRIPNVPNVAQIGLHKSADALVANRLHSEVVWYFGTRHLSELIMLCAEIDEAVDAAAWDRVDPAAALADHLAVAEAAEIAVQYEIYCTFNIRRSRSLLSWTDEIQQVAEHIDECDKYAICALHALLMASCCVRVAEGPESATKNAPRWIRLGETLMGSDGMNTSKARLYLVDGFAALTKAQRIRLTRKEKDQTIVQIQPKLRSNDARKMAMKKHAPTKQDMAKIYAHFVANRKRYSSYADAGDRINQRELNLKSGYSSRTVAKYLSALEKEAASEVTT
jgi:hypothetical protein